MAELTPVDLALEVASNWWNQVNRYPLCHDRIFLLVLLYGTVSLISLVQVLRIHLRVPEYGWTSQKILYFSNFLFHGVRCLVFVFRRDVQGLEPQILRRAVWDMPTLAFFTTYAILPLFWAERYYLARSVSIDGFRPTFYKANAIVYTTQIVIWFGIWWKPIHALVILSKMLIAGVSLFVALGFLLYGGRLFLLLKQFPVEVKGIREKLQEIGCITSICFLCFLARCVMICFNAFDNAADLDALNHPILLMIYYMLVEILPSSVVLFYHRKLPPKPLTNEKVKST